MADLKLSYDNEPRNPLADWALRAAVAVVYVLFGADKFGSGASQWVQLFRDIGIGDWFRYFTGVVEVVGGLLVLIPRTALIGLLLLIATMCGAVVILCLLGRIADSIFPAFFLAALVVIAWTRWTAGRQ